MKITKKNTCTVSGIVILLNAFFVPSIALAKGNETNNVEKVDIGKETLRHNEYLNKFDTVTTNPNHVIKSFKDDKKVKLTLSGKKTKH
ncbi:hypothetical protein [Methanohalobium sp.]|uniref:hypothetical protein n=1 Tax=Methanohalobium sp. TaxID=2837493 RepID=UPI0025E2A6B4|nr:hypothetical protein [Methanohalobium sp.]